MVKRRPSHGGMVAWAAVWLFCLPQPVLAFTITGWRPSVHRGRAFSKVSLLQEIAQSKTRQSCLWVGGKGCGTKRFQPATNAHDLSRCMHPRMGMEAAARINVGCLVVVDGDNKGNRQFLGLVEKMTDNKKPLVFCKHGDSRATVAVPARQVRYVLPGSNYDDSDLTSFTESAVELSDPELVVDAWEILSEEAEAGGGMTEDGDVAGDPAWMAGLLFGSSDPPAKECYAAFCMLEGEEGSFRFKRRRDGLYEPRPRTAVDAVLQAKSKECDAEASRLDLVTRIKEGLKKGGGYMKEPLRMEEFSPVQQEVIKGLKSLALKSVSPWENATDAMEKLGLGLLAGLERGANTANAFHLCVQLGLFQHHENLFALNAGLNNNFPEDALAEAKEIIDNPPVDVDADRRLDLRHLKAYAIDSADTVEVDDALSVERLEGGGERIWVHIADVSRWVKEGSALDREAKRRMTTSYLANDVITMFPLDIAKDVMSLRAGVDTFGLSMAITLGDDGKIMDYSLHPTLLKVDYRLTYHEVEEMLRSGVAKNEESELGRLHELADLRFRFRCSKGAVDRFEKSIDAIVKVRDDPQEERGVKITIYPDDPNMRATRMVTEMMILVGEGMGRLGSDEDIPLPFRKQDAPSEMPDSEFLNHFPEKYCRAQAMYKYMKGATTSFIPGQHWGLGLSSYVQWSSPIRRYLDLLSHYQVKRWARGEGVMEGNQVTATVERGEGAVQTANGVMRNTSRYWIAEYLDRIKGREMEAYVLERRESKGKVSYTLLLLGLGVKIPVQESGQDLTLGETVMAQVVSSSARGAQTKLSWRRLTKEEQSVMDARLVDEEALQRAQ